MAMLTIRNIDDSLKAQLRVQAAQHGNSMEEEVRIILRQALRPKTVTKTGFGTRLHQQLMALNENYELEIPGRSLPRKPPVFDDFS